MPLTTKLEEWLDDKEANRIKKSRDFAAKIIEAFLIKSGKRKDGSSVKIKPNNSRAKTAKISVSTHHPSVSDKKATTGSSTPGVRKYRDATDFMSKNFPTFDN